MKPQPTWTTNSIPKGESEGSAASDNDAMAYWRSKTLARGALFRVPASPSCRYWLPRTSSWPLKGVVRKSIPRLSRTLQKPTEWRTTRLPLSKRTAPGQVSNEMPAHRALWACLLPWAVLKSWIWKCNALRNGRDVKYRFTVVAPTNFCLVMSVALAQRHTEALFAAS